MQKEGYKGLTGLRREKPCKKNGENEKKSDWSLDRIVKREKIKKLLKK